MKRMKPVLKKRFCSARQAGTMVLIHISFTNLYNRSSKTANRPLMKTWPPTLPQPVSARTNARWKAAAKWRSRSIKTKREGRCLRFVFRSGLISPASHSFSGQMDLIHAPKPQKLRGQANVVPASFLISCVRPSSGHAQLPVHAFRIRTS